MIRAIPVRDAHGDQLTLYEYEQSQPTAMSANRAGETTRLALDTGEAVRRIDDDHFVIVATGERLTRVG